MKKQQSVSYTHLDVYKRQAVLLAAIFCVLYPMQTIAHSGIISSPHQSDVSYSASGETAFSEEEIQNKPYIIGAVSYTHLLSRAASNTFIIQLLFFFKKNSTAAQSAPITPRHTAAGISSAAVIKTVPPNAALIKIRLNARPALEPRPSAPPNGPRSKSVFIPFPPALR